MGLFNVRYRTRFSFGGPLYFFAFGFVIGFWREGWGTGRVKAGGGWGGGVNFSWPDISLRIPYTPILYLSALYTFFRFEFSYRILEGGFMHLVNFRYRTRFFARGGHCIFRLLVFLLDFRGKVGGTGRGFVPVHFLSLSFPIGFWREGWGAGRV